MSRDAAEAVRGDRPDAWRGGADTAPGRLTRHLFSGSLWGVAGQVATLAASLVATPFVIRLLGVESYGVLVLCHATLAYLAFADLGMSVASTRYAADVVARGNSRSESRVIWTALVLSLFSSVIFAVILAVSARWIVTDALRLPLALREKATTALRLVGAILIVRSAGNVLNTPLLVRFRIAAYAVLQASVGVGQIVLIPVVLSAGGDLVSALMVMLASNTIALCIQAFWCWRLLPGVVVPQFSTRLVRPLVRFGSAMSVVVAAGALLLFADRPVLARLGSVRDVSFYAVAVTLARILTVLPGAMNPILLPALSRLQAAEDRERLRWLYSVSARGLILVTVPIAVSLCAFADPILRHWAGPEFAARGVIALRWLAVGAAFEALSYVPRSVLEAAGRPDLVARLQVAQLVPYFAIFCLVAAQYGIEGAAFVWTVRVAVETLCLFWMAHRSIGMEPKGSRSPVWRFAALIGIAITAHAVNRTLGNGLAGGAAAVGVFLPAYGWVAWRCLLNSEERSFMRGLFAESASVRAWQGGS